MSTLTQESSAASVNNKKAVNPNSNFMGAAGQAAVAIGNTLTNFYKFLKQQAFLKAAETKNVLSAAQNQASAMIAQGKKTMLGAFFQGGAMIASGVVGVAASGYSAYKSSSLDNNAELRDINARAPTILNDISDARAANVDPKYNTGLTAKEFNDFLKDPRTAPDGDAINARLKNHDFTPEQQAQFDKTVHEFNAGTAPLQVNFEKSLNKLDDRLNRGRETFGYLARGFGDLGKGREDALAARDQAAGTVAQAAQTQANSAISAIEQFMSQVANLIEALYRTIGALAAVNK